MRRSSKDWHNKSKRRRKPNRRLYLKNSKKKNKLQLRNRKGKRNSRSNARR